ncbi:MAG: hypothetical protein AB9836_11380 [Aminipila sp.]
MKLEFNLDDKKINYELDTFWGKEKVWVDGNLTKTGFFMLGGKKKLEFRVGENVVKIFIRQPIFLAFFRNRTFEILVNNKLYKVFDKKGNLLNEFEL